MHWSLLQTCVVPWTSHKAWCYSCNYPHIGRLKDLTTGGRSSPLEQSWELSLRLWSQSVCTMHIPEHLGEAGVIEAQGSKAHSHLLATQFYWPRNLRDAPLTLSWILHLPWKPRATGPSCKGHGEGKLWLRRRLRPTAAIQSSVLAGRYRL